MFANEMRCDRGKETEEVRGMLTMGSSSFSTGLACGART